MAITEFGGCTGDSQFHEALEMEWEEIEAVAVPQWHGLHDRMLVFRRKGKRR